MIGWYLGDAWSRPLYPGSDVSVDDYIRRRLASFEADDGDLDAADRTAFEAEVRRELEIAFPGHPLLAEP
jgi:hypothetical protein